MLNIENLQKEQEKQSKIADFINTQFNQMSVYGKPDLKKEISNDFDTMLMEKTNILDLKIDSK